MTKPNDWRILTPVLVSLSPIFLGIIGWFLVDNLFTIRNDIKIQTEKIEKIVDQYAVDTVKSEGRFSKVETEIKGMDSRISRLEYIRGKNGS